MSQRDANIPFELYHPIDMRDLYSWKVPIEHCGFEGMRTGPIGSGIVLTSLGFHWYTHWNDHCLALDSNAQCPGRISIA